MNTPTLMNRYHKPRLDIWWDGLASYASSCWRELANRSDIDLHVVTIKLPKSSNAQFNADLIHDLPVTFVEESRLREAVESRLKSCPDVIALTGWSRKAYRAAVPKIKKKGIKLLLSIDTPWRASLKQLVGLTYLRYYASRFDGAIVAGERSWQYANKLGLGHKQIYKILYAVDDKMLNAAFVHRSQLQHWPKNFLFVGRLVAEKDIETLVAGYQRYRLMSTSPWPLTCVGTGPESYRLQGQEGIIPAGFKQPSEMQELWQSHGAFVISSAFDPWPLAIVEACRTGLPIIHTVECGSAVENVREFYNGISYKAGDVERLAKSLLEIESRYPQLKEMGTRSRQLTDPYSSSLWAENWSRMAYNILDAT